MITVIGRPSQSQFRHVSRSYDQAACAVGNIHQNLRTLSRLPVFIGNIMLLNILSDIPEMYRYGFPDIDFLKNSTQRAGQLAGIIVGSVRCAETRHRHGSDLLSVNSQHIKSTGRHQKRQCRIQAARNADHRRLASCMFIPFLKAVRLNGQNLLTAFLPLFPIGRYERPWAESTFQRRLFFFHMNRQHQIPFPSLRQITHHPSSLMP